MIKLHRHSGKVSYLTYPDFDADPHPAFSRSIKLNLRTRAIESTDYAASANPSVLHRKEAFLLPADPRRGKFERLTRQEERAGLLDDDRDDRHPGRLGRAAAGAGVCTPRASAGEVPGHRLVRCRTTDTTGEPDHESHGGEPDPRPGRS